MTKFFFIGLFILTTSCAHKKSLEVAHEIPVNPDWVNAENFVSSRTPASAEEFLNDIEKLDHQKKTSLRRVYFKALYDQYLRWNQAQEGMNPLSSCPQYHHDKLTVEETYQAQKAFVTPVSSYPSKEELMSHPEWFLSLKKKGKKMRAFEWGQKEKANPQVAMNKAIKGQWKNLEQELTVMCEEGVSENFFKIENIVTYFSNREDFDSGVKGLKAFMKIPVFANILIENSVTHASASDIELSRFEDELLNYASAWQIRSYAFQLKKENKQQYANK